MELPSFPRLLAALRSADGAVRADGEAAYADAQRRAPGETLALLLRCADASAEGLEDAARLQAATLFRRAALQAGAAETMWARAGPQAQAECRRALLRALRAEPGRATRRVLVAAIAAVASAEAGAPWPELLPEVFALAGASAGGAEGHRQQEDACWLLAELVGTGHAAGILERRAELGQLVLAGLGTPTISAAALWLVCALTSGLDADACRALQGALPAMEAALRGLAAADATAFTEALQSLIVSAGEKAAFFKPRVAEWVDMMFAFAAARNALEDGARSLALEFVSTLVESKSRGAVLKAAPSLPERALAASFAFLAELEEGDAERWAGIDEDVEEDDDEGLHRAGEAKVDFFVRRLGFATVKATLSALLQRYSASGQWKERLASAMAARASVEYLAGDDAAADAVAAMLLGLTADEHMRVRYAALFALGQMCHDLGGPFAERWHGRLAPALLRTCADPVDRVSAKATSTLEALVGELDRATLAELGPAMLQVLLERLRSSSHCGVLVAVMEALGALSLGMGAAFAAYYDGLMAPLLAFVGRDGSAADRSAGRLRSKAFECISLLGLAVGQERFAPAARHTMEAMLRPGAAGADDLHSGCIRDAMGRICKTLGGDFAEFLPTLLPGILAGLRLETAVQRATEIDDLVDGNDDDLVVPTEDGLLKVNTGQITEMLSVVGLLQTILGATGERFFDFLPATAETLARILGAAGSVLTVASGVRDAVYPCWADLVGVATKVVPTRGEAAQAAAADLVRQFIDKVGADIAQAEDPEDIAAMAKGIASVVRSAGPGCLGLEEVRGVTALAVSEILKSLQREEAMQAEEGDAEEDDGVDEDDLDLALADAGLDLTEERECRSGLSSILAACLRTDADAFLAAAMPTLEPLMRQWLAGPGPGRVLGLSLACGLCEHVGEPASEAWPIFMEQVMEAADSADAEERSVAAATIIAAARAPQFSAQYAARAHGAVAAALRWPPPKRSDDGARLAADRAVAAMCQLCLSHPGASPDLGASWGAVFAQLPLKVDFEEGRRLHRLLFAEAQRPDGGSFGSLARAAQALGYLCEASGQGERHADAALRRELGAALARLPPASLQGLLAQFSAKQRKRAELLLADGS